MHDHFAISLIVWLVVGVLAQRTRLCMVGGLCDAVLFKDFYLLSDYRNIRCSLIGNLALGFFHAEAAHENEPRFRCA